MDWFRLRVNVKSYGLDLGQGVGIGEVEGEFRVRV